MNNVVVTVEFENGNRSDLALPLSIPCHVLANAVAQALALEGENKDFQFSLKSETGGRKVPAQSTLGDLGVLDGFVLELHPEKNLPARPALRQAALRAEDGRTFLLEANSLVIGRNDVRRGWVVDIDLSPFDSQKIVSRKHARIRRQNSTWVLEEDSECKNGSWLNGQKLAGGEPYPLQDGDEIILGRNGVALRFVE